MYRARSARICSRSRSATSPMDSAAGLPCGQRPTTPPLFSQSGANSTTPSARACRMPASPDPMSRAKPTGYLHWATRILKDWWF